MCGHMNKLYAKMTNMTRSTKRALCSMNPEERGKYEKKMMEQAEAHKHATKQNKLIMEEHRKLKNLMAAQKNSGKAHIGKKKRGMRGKKKKMQFGPRLEGDKSNDEIAAKFKLSSRIAKNQLLEDAETTNQTNSGKPLHKKSRSFRAHKTAEGKVYYSDTNTNETRWYLPEDAVLL